MIAMTVIDATSAGHRRRETIHILRSVSLALLMLVFGIGSGMGSPGRVDRYDRGVLRCTAGPVDRPAIAGTNTRSCARNARI
jgi:hypothetical protein